MSLPPDKGSPWSTPRKALEQESVPKDARGFPPLNAKGPSKAQLRARQRYTQSAHFEPYPPRIDQLTRQELLRLGEQYDQAAQDYADDDDDDMEEIQPPYVQKSGMSSVTVYDENGQRLSSGPDIYRRKAGGRHKKDSGKARSGSSLDLAVVSKGVQEVEQEAHRQSSQTILPIPFTDQRIDVLTNECQRRQRVDAIARRSTSTGTNQQDSNEPITGELLKAFSSLQGFIAAFGRDSVGEKG
jgi:hypothetical protein